MKTLKLFLKLNLTEALLLASIFIPLFIVTVAIIIKDLKIIF